MMQLLHQLLQLESPLGLDDWQLQLPLQLVGPFQLLLLLSLPACL